MIAPDLTCETLRVDLGERSYDIMIGPHLLGFVGKYADLLSKSKKVAVITCLLYTSPSPRDLSTSRMPSSA